MHLIHFPLRLSLVYRPEQCNHPAPLSKLSSSVSTRLGSSQFSESKDDDCIHLMFTTNDLNVCVTRTGMFLLLQPYFGGRFPLISSLFPLSVHLKFVRKSSELVKIAANYFRKANFFWLFFFPAKGIWNRVDFRGQENNGGIL